MDALCGSKTSITHAERNSLNHIEKNTCLLNK